MFDKWRFNKVSLATPLKLEVQKTFIESEHYDSSGMFKAFEDATGHPAPTAMRMIGKHYYLAKNSGSLIDFYVLLMTHHKEEFRPLMQWWGDTRRQQDPDYFVKLWISEAKRYKNVVVDDIRFPNEIRAIQEFTHQKFHSSQYFEDIGIRDPEGEEAANKEGIPNHISEALTFDKEPHPNTVINNRKSQGLEEFHKTLDEYFFEHSSLSKRGLTKR
jgi:hypothetical protein